MELLILRHGSTLWNLERRYQGATDIPLSPEGRSEALRWRSALPSDPDILCASPLARARETAALLYPGKEIFLHDGLREMSVGEWEGRRMSEVREGLSPAEIKQDWMGLDHAAPGGESPRLVQARLREWLGSLPKTQGLAVVVSHKMAITALYALATGWDMGSRPPVRPRFPRIHRFRWDGALSVAAINEPLERA